MAKTIIQTIGPLYGEPINGTVFGRPNGSIYVPAVNTINAKLPNSYVSVFTYNGRYYLTVCNSEGVFGSVNLVAQSQDNANYMAWEFADDSEFTTPTVFSKSAGLFNITETSLGVVSASFEVKDSQTYYLRAVLYASTGVPVAYSDTYELTGVVNE